MLLRNLSTKLRSRLRRGRPRPMILMYHRVAAVHHDPWALAVTVDHFEEQIAHLKKHRRPMSMTELVSRLRADALPAEAVAITFDDGYRDNLIHAKPVLMKHGVPATFFIATGYTDGPSPFWWDELASMILASSGPAKHVETCAGEHITLTWGEPESADITGRWRVDDGPQTARQRSYLAMWRSLQRAGEPERDRVMRSLRAAFSIRSDPLAMPMSSGELHELLSGDIMAIGAHSVGHPVLTTLSRSENRREIEESAATCRAMSGKPVEGFAYPYGDVDRDTRENVTRAGFAWACSTRGAFLDGQPSDVFALPRIAVQDVPLRLFRSLIQ
jgi:peptidoglycan/xylan/chitin deacetylase (PgdA/CDA1 family)